MTRTVMTYGDSNTHGTKPIVTTGESRRFKPTIRWPRVMASALGPRWALIEEGLPGRTTAISDPIMGPHMNGALGLKIALASHKPVDVLTIMLGTNDLKTRFFPSGPRIAAGIAGLLDHALHRDVSPHHPNMKILLICPPAVKEVGPLRGEFIGAAAHGPTLAPALAELAKARGVGFFDAGSVIETSDVDGVHFEADAHQLLGNALAKVIADLT
ncbi:SGNH/GDSL hydrolase family protein [Phaeobacter sp. J2-8]|uniref:SGNH/GDSL hydrolase family protein n=1 Tax=Phaeobacter sp. J2-8 TaxID=2931394 RepID=UPI001FD3A2D0|nr:SGNH/GDSL hydrolase family protein [Phaeobacter sp. J2-8]MCJ7872609.1 SGNH/GDSL hydrolase family protein [Phaeobacter sp. J2-8]